MALDSGAASAPSTSSGSVPGASQGASAPPPTGAPVAESARDFFGGSRDSDQGQVPDQDLAAQDQAPDQSEGENEQLAPADPLDALLERADPETRAAAKKALDALRSSTGRVQAEARRATENEQANLQNFESATGWKRVAELAVAKAREAGIDVTNIEQLAGESLRGAEQQEQQAQDPTQQQDDGTNFENGYGADSLREFSSVAAPLYDAQFGEAWEQGYAEKLDKIDNMLRLAYGAAENGDDETAKAYRAQARKAGIALQRENALMTTAPTQALVFALGQHLAALREEVHGEKRAAQEQAQFRGVLSEAAFAFGIEKDDSTGALRYPGLFQNNTVKPSESGKRIVQAIGQWCQRYGADPRDPEAWDEAYHAVVRRNPQLAPTAPKVAGPRTPGGDSALGSSAAPTAGNGGLRGTGALTDAERRDLAQRRNLSQVGQGGNRAPAAR